MRRCAVCDCRIVPSNSGDGWEHVDALPSDHPARPDGPKTEARQLEPFDRIEPGDFFRFEGEEIPVARNWMGKEAYDFNRANPYGGVLRAVKRERVLLAGEQIEDADFAHLEGGRVVITRDVPVPIVPPAGERQLAPEEIVEEGDKIHGGYHDGEILPHLVGLTAGEVGYPVYRAIDPVETAPVEIKTSICQYCLKPISFDGNLWVHADGGTWECDGQTEGYKKMGATPSIVATPAPRKKLMVPLGIREAKMLAEAICPDRPESMTVDELLKKANEAREYMGRFQKHAATAAEWPVRRELEVGEVIQHGDTYKDGNPLHNRHAGTEVVASERIFRTEFVPIVPTSPPSTDVPPERFVLNSLQKWLVDGATIRMTPGGRGLEALPDGKWSISDLVVEFPDTRSRKSVQRVECDPPIIDRLPERIYSRIHDAVADAAERGQVFDAPAIAFNLAVYIADELEKQAALITPEKWDGVAGVVICFAAGCVLTAAVIFGILAHR